MFDQTMSLTAQESMTRVANPATLPASKCAVSHSSALAMSPGGSSSVDCGASPSSTVSCKERTRAAPPAAEPLSARRPSRQRSTFLKQWLGKHRSDANDTPGVGPVNSYMASAEDLGAGLRGLTCKPKPLGGAAAKRAASGSGTQCIAADGLDSPSKTAKASVFAQRRGARAPTSARVRNLLPKALREVSAAEVTRGVSALSVRRSAARVAILARQDSGDLSAEASAGSGGYWSSRKRKPRYCRKAKVCLWLELKGGPATPIALHVSAVLSIRSVAIHCRSMSSVSPRKQRQAFFDGISCCSSSASPTGARTSCRPRPSTLRSSKACCRACGQTQGSRVRHLCTLQGKRRRPRHSARGSVLALTLFVD